ncbi:hypothetical protein [Paenibacillus bovis]|uniref:Uncharacterized protein n=1 Tax=Paenibacillus bovis TaxID=1616788 RepID=A0A1X9T4H3_9BACL|nr:hypothetical protein [Paenibacillus bovis]ARR10766.1 hypothetical protein AR543_p0158 [Paenibacillus bovis]
MKNIKRFLPISVLMFTLSLIVAASAFAALGEGWHDNLSSRQGRTLLTGTPTYIPPGGTIRVAVDQYAKNAAGNYDSTKSPNVTYYIHKEDTLSSNDFHFDVPGNRGGATGKAAYTSQTYTVTGGYYTIHAVNNSTFPVATGGNTYYTN